MHNEIKILAKAEDEGKRLDKFLSEQIGYLSRSRLQALIRQGLVRATDGAVDGMPDGIVVDKISHKITPTDIFTLTLPEPEPVCAEPQAMPLDIVFEDEALIVVNKPAGLCVHPDKVHRDSTLVNGLLHHCAGELSGIGGKQRPGIVHRLDKDTSGILVCAKTQHAHIHLAQQFAAHGADGKLSRSYLALVWGKPPPGPELIDAPIGRHPLQRQKMAVLKLGGKSARTQFSLLERVGDKASLMRCSLFTGRTHQIRVHLHWRGWSIVGDKVYTLRKNNFPLPINRQALHATHLGFTHPLTQEALSFERPPPDDFQAAYENLRENYPLANQN